MADNKEEKGWLQKWREKKYNSPASKGKGKLKGSMFAKDKKKEQKKEQEKWFNNMEDGGRACKMNALKSLAGGKKPKMIKATVMAKDADGLLAASEKMEDVAKSMGGKEKKEKSSKKDALKALKKLLAKK